MLRLRLSKRTHLLSFNFGITNFFKNLITRSSNYFRDSPEQVQKFSLRNVDPSKPDMPRTTKQATKAIQATESEVNYLQKQRLKSIDKALGTRTYFYEAKSYQIKLDSEHVMMVKRMKMQNILDGWKAPVRYDSKVCQDLRLRNKKKHWKNLAKIRKYPEHKSVDFSDESNVSFLEFMAKEVLFTRMSFNSVEDLKNYFLKQDIEVRTYLLYSPKYIYYNIPNTPLLGRTLKSKFPAQTRLDQIKQSDIQVVMSLDQIYNELLKHDSNPFVEEFLKGIENGTLKGTITESIKWTEDQNHLVVLIDLTGEKKQFAIVVKNLMSGMIVNVILDTAGYLGVMKNKVFFIRRDNLEILSELCYYNIQTKETNLIYKQSNHLNLEFSIDINGQYLYLYRIEPSNQWNQLIHVLGFENKDHVVQIPTEPGYQYEIGFTEKGFVYCKYEKNDKGEYPPMFKRISKQLYFIPLSIKGEITTVQEDRRLRKIEEMKEVIKNYNQIADTKIEIRNSRKQISISDKHEIIYKCEDDEAIQSMLNMKNEIVLNIIKKWSVPDYKPDSKLHIIPRKEHSTESSLVIPDQYITFSKGQDAYSQTVVFKLKNVTQPIFNFTTWNEELEQDRPDTIHTEMFYYQNRNGIKQNMSLYFQEVYSGKVLDTVFIYCDQKEEEIDYATIKSLLKKGILVAVFKGRGSVYGSKQNYEDGIGSNTINGVNDLIDAALSLHEAGRTTNVGIYAKGAHPSNVVALATILQPYLFIATVIHNGNYGFKQQAEVRQKKRYQQHTDLPNKQKVQFRIPAIPFSGRQKELNAVEIDDISNITISTLISSKQKEEARRLIHYLRKSERKYDEIFYKQYETNREADLTNICFLYRLIVDNSEEYSKIRDDFT